jgi:DNA-binding NtrC family response regulator
VSKAPRILIVDDDVSLRKVLKTILEEEGYVVDVAESGEEAIEKSNTQSYNLVFIDIKLPDMDGTKLLIELKETTPKMVKIVITGFPSLENAIQAVNQRADAYILKPFDVEKILKMVKEHLKKQHEDEKFDEEKVAEFIEGRVKRWQQERTETLS